MTNINETFLKQVGKRLQELRKSTKLTQVQLSNLLLEQYNITIDDRSISRYETGRGLPETDNLIYLADLFNTTLDYIIYGKETSDDNSFTWYDNFKRLNRLIYTMQIKPCRSNTNASDVYLQLLDDEAKEWFGRIERYIENRKNMFIHKGLEKEIAVKDLDSLFEEFKKDRTQLLPIEEKIRRSIVSAKPIVTTRVQEENEEITIVSKIHR